MEARPGVPWWGRHKERRTVTPEMATMLSPAGCRAQHCAWHGRSRACPPGFVPCPKTLSGPGLGRLQSQACGQRWPRARHCWGPQCTGITNHRGASSRSARPSHGWSPPGWCEEVAGFAPSQGKPRGHCVGRAWGSASQVLSPEWQGTEPMVAGWVLNPIHLHAQLQGEGEHPAAPQLWGTSLLPHSSWLRGIRATSHDLVGPPLLPRVPWISEDIPAAPHAMTCGRSHCPTSHRFGRTSLLPHIPWLGEDIPATPCRKA